MQLHITVRTVAGRETKINAHSSDTVDKLKAILEHDMGIPAKKQVLVSLGHDTSDCEMLPGHWLHEYEPEKVLVIRELPAMPRGKPPPRRASPASKRGAGGGKGKQAGGRGPLLGRQLPPRPPCPPFAPLLRPGVEVTATVPPAVPSTAPEPHHGSCGSSAAAVAAAAPPPPAQEQEQPGRGPETPAPAIASGGSGKAPQTEQSLPQPQRDCRSGSVLQLEQGPPKEIQQILASSGLTMPVKRVTVPVAPSRLATSHSFGDLAAKPQESLQQQSAPALVRSASSGGSGALAPPVPPPLTKEAPPVLGAQPKGGSGPLEAAAPVVATRVPSSGAWTPGAAGPQAALPPAVLVPAPQPLARLPAPSSSLSWSPPATLPQGPATHGEASPPSAGRLVASHSHSPCPVTCSSSPPGGSRERLVPALTWHSPQAQTVRRSDLQRIGRLGVGAFGVVTLESDRRTGRTYALKAVSKTYLAQLRMEYSVLNEKRILEMVDSPFVVRLVTTYNGREHVYFLLEAALGGELFTTYERLQLYGSEKHARFYMGCVAEALAHLHERHVIYRDLKPENLLLDARGYCKLTDMGLAKVTQDKTYTLAGTPDYMAPEVIAQTGHGKSVDWWMLGVLLFELLVGRAPFEAPSTAQVYELIKRGIEAVRFPEKCRRLAQDLVCSLCRATPEARLRMPVLREHAWFGGFQWGALRALRLPAPYIPSVKGPRDLANFRQCDGEEPGAIA